MKAGMGWLEGPIPARAGEPQAAHKATMDLGAYPRSRGGTLGAG